MTPVENAPSLPIAMLVRLSLEAFADRTMRFLTMLSAFVLCGAVVRWPRWESLLAASLFILLVAPLWWRRESPHGQ